MNKIRIGKDIKILLKVMTNGESISLEGRNLELHLRNPFGDVSVIPHSVRGDVMEARFGGAEQKYCGVYTLTIWENKGGVDSTALDFEKAFELVSSTSLETPKAESLETEEVIKLSGDMSVGVQGASAYEIAVANGFKGTEAEWLESLKLHYADLTAEEKAELQKPITDIAAGVAEGERQRQQAEEIRKSAEVGRLGEEEKRVASEIERKTTEDARVADEEKRASAEVLRTEAEVLRTEAEQNRASAENLRTESEVLRTTAESKRSEAEVQRMTDEDLRKVAEQGRATAELARANAEAERVKAESLRASEEKVRVTSEEGRKTAESARVSAEQQRNTAEQARVTAEEKRQQQTASAIEATKSATASAVTATADAVKATSDAKNATTGANEAASKADVAAQGIDGKIGDIRETIDTMRKEGNALLGDVATGKKLIAEAVTKKGIPTAEGDSFKTMADNIGKIYKGDLDKMFTLTIDDNVPTGTLERTGGAAFPNWLEAGAQGLMVKDGEVMYQLDRRNHLRRANGLEAVIDGSDGDIFVRLREFWYNKVEIAPGVRRYTFSPEPQTSEGWEHSPEIWVGCTEMVIEQKDKKNIAHSCYNMAKEFRGGSDNAAWDNNPISLLGMPRTSLNHAQMREACKNKGEVLGGVYHQFDHRTYKKINMMFMCIYGSRNWQAPWSGIDPNTGDEYRNEEGYKYGGLGTGVTTGWGKYGNQPFVKTNCGLERGVLSGEADYAYDRGEVGAPNVVNIKVPVFLGIVNPFGHVFHAIDGLTLERFKEEEVLKDKWGFFDNPRLYASSGVTGAARVVMRPFVNGGNIATTDDDFLPTLCKNSGYYFDNYWTSQSISQYSVWQGGHAGIGGACGGFSVYAYYGVGLASSDFGGRLCFSPS